MPVSNLLTTLIERLLDLTSKGKIDWQETASENDFLASVSQYVVTISSITDTDSWGSLTTHYWIRVANREGTLVDSASDADLGDRPADDQVLGRAGIAMPGTSRPPAEILKLLFDAARRKALNVDKALGELISSLDSIGRSK